MAIEEMDDPKPRLRVFVSTDFEGRYPVGVCAVVVAEDEAAARRQLNDEIVQRRLNPCPELTFTEIETDEPSAVIFLDGDY